MKILVTGGAGFIGSHTVDMLIAAGNEVTVIDNLYTGKRENINPSAVFHEMDVRDKEVLGLLKKDRYNAVMHFAAQMDVRRSVEDPFYDADVNIVGGINLLEACVKTGVSNFVFASSGGVMYGECPDEKPTEEKQPNPLCPYGVSKLSFEFYLNYYRHNYGISTTTLRFGNVYGPRQDPHGEAGVVAIFSGAMLREEPVKIFGDGEQIRDYVYVSDVASACVRALDGGQGVYNIGTGVSESVNELFGIIRESTEYTREPKYVPGRPGELQASRLDPSKAERELGWVSSVGFREGLDKTIEYFRPEI